MKVREHKLDPVFVKAMSSRQKVELRIGEAQRGKSRYGWLKPHEARRVGYALLLAAEEAQGEPTT